MLITGVYDGSRHGGAQLDGAPRFLRSSVRAGRLRVRIPPPCLGSVLIILLTLPLFLIHEPFAKPSKISDFIPLNGFFLNSVSR